MEVSKRKEITRRTNAHCYQYRIQSNLVIMPNTNTVLARGEGGEIMGDTVDVPAASTQLVSHHAHSYSTYTCIYYDKTG